MDNFTMTDNFQQFIDDVERHGLEWEDYHGRWYFHGPATMCDDIADVMSITSAKCQYDQLGLGYIVYPK